jgi:tetratricopeptide (TPR) repeat protein
MPKASRAALHERVAERLEATGADEAVVGHHLEQAVRYHDELGRRDEKRLELAARGGRLLGFAGGRARVRGDLPAAVALLERSVALLPNDDAQHATLLAELGSVQIGTGRFAAAGATLHRATAVAKELGDRRSAVRAQIELEFLRAFATPTEPRDAGAAERLLREAEALGDDLGLAKAWWLRSEPDAIACRWRARAESLEQALEYARRAADVRDEVATLTALLAQALYFGPTPVAQAIERCQELLREVAGDDRPLRAALTSTLGGLLGMQGELERGRALYDDAMAIYDELGQRFRRAARAHIGAKLALFSDDPAEAERVLRNALETLADIGAQGVQATLAAVLADMLAEFARDDEAEELADQIENTAGADDLASQVLRRTALARVFLHRGDTERAEALAAEAVDLTNAIEFPELRARALLAAADATRDAALADEGRRVYEQKGNLAAARLLLASRLGAE